MGATLTRPGTYAERQAFGRRPDSTGHYAGTDPLHTYTETADGLEVLIDDAIPTTGERLGDIDLDLVAHLLRTTYDIPAVAEHMGGGCGAIAYGPMVKIDHGNGDAYDTPRWLAGPGTYMHRHYGHSVGVLHEFGTSMDNEVAGTDDLGNLDLASVGAVTHSQIAAVLATVAAFGTFDGPLDADRIEALGLDSTLRSTPRWLTEDMEAIAVDVAERNRINHARHEQAAAARSYIPEGY